MKILKDFSLQIVWLVILLFLWITFATSYEFETRWTEHYAPWGMSTREWNDVDPEFKEKFIRYWKYHETWDRDLFPMDIRYTVLSEWHPWQVYLNYLYSKFEDKELAMDMVLTVIDENRRLSLFAQSQDNERGLWQLQYRWHKDFIESKRFPDGFSQMDYVAEIYYDWKLRKWWISPRAGWYKKERYRDLIEFID